MNEIKIVKNCGTCSCYDDGHGNGGYCSGMDVGPPSCRHPHNTDHKTPTNSKIVPKWCPLRKGDYIKHEITHIKLSL